MPALKNLSSIRHLKKLTNLKTSILLSIRYTLAILLCASLFLSCEESQKSISPSCTSLDTFYHANPGAHGVLMYTEGPNLADSCAVGWADSTAGIELETNTPFLMASITKMYMSSAILRLCELNPVVNIDSSIERYISIETLNLLKGDGYKTDKITVTHLLTNSSGIADYVETDSFQYLAEKHPNYAWKRREQIALAMRHFDPLFEPGERFHYSDVNFLLLGEILEHYTKKPFYSAVRDLLEFHKNGLHHTWWDLFEQAPDDLPPVASQFAISFNSYSKTLHPSFDLYGGGGLVCTAKDLARFTKMLFEGQCFEKPETLALLTGRHAPTEEFETSYRLGVMSWNENGHTAYGHGGFWGSMVQYFPDIQTAVVIVPMERNYWRDAITFCGEYAESVRLK